MSRHTLSVLVENKPGVLARVAALFSRRGFNIDSLAVGPTEHEDISRMTIVVNVEDLPLEQVTKQLNKLVNVLKIVELDPVQSVQRELILIKVRADAENRSQRPGDWSSCSAPAASTSPRTRSRSRSPARRTSWRRSSGSWSRSASRNSCSRAWWPSAAAPVPSPTVRCGPSTGARESHRKPERLSK